MKNKKIILIGLSALLSRGLTGQTSNNVGTSYAGTPAALNGANSQLMNAQDNQVLFQGNNVFATDALRNTIKMGIGVFNSPINGIVDRLHLNDITASTVFSRFTNLTTGQTATDGFGVGIDGSGNASIQQYENLPLRFYTNNSEAMRILGNGNVGIGSLTPGNKLEITGAAGASGLRFTNLTSASTAGGATSKVLSVDATGNVILMNPTSAAATAANGLNTTVSGTGAVELGGNLIRPTLVSLSTFDLTFTDPNAGRFGIGGYVTPANINGPISAMNSNTGKIVFDNGTTNLTQKIYAYVPATYTASPIVYGLDVDVRNDNATSMTTTKGGFAIKTLVSSEGSNTGVSGYITSSNANTGTNIGFDAHIVNGKSAVGVNAYSSQDPAYESNTSSNNTGVIGYTNDGYDARGVYGLSVNAIRNQGGYFAAQQSSGNGAFAYNKGLFSQAVYGPNNIGVDGYASGQSNSAVSSIGVYGHASNGSGTDIDLIGVKGECSSAGGNHLGTSNYLAGYFVGDVLITGTGYYTGFSVITSDRQLKTNINPLENALDIITKLSPKTYNLTNENCKQLDFTGIKTQYGLIAQEVESVFPDIVYSKKVPAKLDTLGKVVYPQKEVKGISYEQLISVLIKGAQEQQKQITDLTALVKILSDKLDNAGQTLNKTAGSTSNPGAGAVNLSDANVVVLDQNVPNPFFESTVINYILPVNYQTAKIVFTNNEGKFIKEVDLSTITGNSLTVYASNLSNGIYNYTLTVDGKVIDTKKMVKD